MNLRGFLFGRLKGFMIPRAQRRILSLGPTKEIVRQDWEESLRDPTAFYARCYRYFHYNLPIPFKEHRKYFTAENRGFGEDAFHAMWFFLFREFMPQSFLEIGVYRGQVLSLAAMLQRDLQIPNPKLLGISPFAPIGDSVSKYGGKVDYLADTLSNFEHFGLTKPRLLKAYSTDPEAVAAIAAESWDCIYIDGNHDYAVAKADWENCAKAVRPGGIIVLDDSGLTTGYAPPLFATKGHPGPSRVAEEIDVDQFREILQVGHNRVFQKIGAK